jgi:branched-chain amino acid transport system substrate-binding protein
MIITAFVSSITRAVGPIAQQNGIPHLTTGSALPSLHREFDTMVQSLTPQYRTDMVDMMATNDDIEATKIATWAVDGEVMKYALETVKEAVAEYDEMEIVYEEVHPFEQQDYAPLALNAANAGADAVLMSNYYDHFIPSMRAINNADFEPDVVSNVIGATSQSYNELGGELIEGTIVDSTWHPAMDTPESDAYVENFNSVSEAGVLADYQGATTFMTMQVLGKALEEIGNGVKDNEAFLEWLHQAQVDAVSGTWEVDEDGVQTGIGWKETQWQGTNTPMIYPDEYKMADVLYPKTWP